MPSELIAGWFRTTFRQRHAQFGLTTFNSLALLAVSRNALSVFQEWPLETDDGGPCSCSYRLFQLCTGIRSDRSNFRNFIFKRGSAYGPSKFSASFLNVFWI